MKKIIFAAFIIIASCKSISYSDLRPSGPLPLKLPSLDPQINIRSLESVYSLGYTQSNGSAYTQPVKGTNGFVTVGGSTSTHYADSRIQDVIIIFERDVKDNITKSVGQNFGYMTLSIGAGDSRHKIKLGNFYLSCVLIVPFLCGITVGEGITTLDIEVEIKNKTGDTVGRYSAMSTSRKPVALWRGYTSSNAVRLSNIECIKDCLNQIKSKIQADYPQFE